MEGEEHKPNRMKTDFNLNHIRKRNKGSYLNFTYFCL